MRSIVVAYEDKYCEELHLLIKALRRDRQQPAVILESRTVKGTGGFANEVRRLLRDRLKQTKQPPDRVVCVGDADRPRDLVPHGLEAPKGDDRQAIHAWVLELERMWRQYLIENAHVGADDETRLRVACLRWSKESLLIASPDALRGYAARRRADSRLQALLEMCDPKPTELGDHAFMTSYRKPGKCLDDVFQTIENRGYKKGRDDEDLLREHITPNAQIRDQLLRRSPDLSRLLDELGSE